MAFVSFASSLFLSLLLCFSLTAYAGDETLATYPPAEAPHPPPPHHQHHHHHHHPPPPPPTKPPTPPPSHKSPPPPSHSPPPPPTHKHPPPPRHPSPPPPTHKYPPPPPPPTHKYPPPPPTHKHPPPPSPKYPPPSPPPVKPPVKPPTYPPMRKKVAVQGVVYCKSCKYRGVDTLSGAVPLSGAIVKLQCNNTKYTLKEQKTTDKNGYFFFMPPSLTTAGSHKCKVTLVSSPLATCNVPTNLHGGALGALLTRPRKPPVDAPKKPLPFELFTVGPFAFEASKKLPCHY